MDSRKLERDARVQWCPLLKSVIRKKEGNAKRTIGSPMDAEVPTMKVSVFIGTSVDGFIARPNGDLDFLPPGGGEPHGYNEFIATVDAIVIGRKTFETVLAMEDWPYGGKRVVVLSSRPVDLSGARGVVEQMAGAPAEIVSQLAASGAHHLYVDGGITIQGFLRAG